MSSSSKYFCVGPKSYWFLLSSIMILGIFLIASSSAAIHANNKLPPVVRESNGFQGFMLFLGLVLTIFTVPYFIAVVYQVETRVTGFRKNKKNNSPATKNYPDGPWKSIEHLKKDILSQPYEVNISDPGTEMTQSSEWQNK